MSKRKPDKRLIGWINRQRAWRITVKGKIRSLPLGIQEDPCECVLARALGGNARLNGDGTWNVTPWRTEPLPKYVRDFERRFDDGEYPDLIDDSGIAQRADVANYYAHKWK